MMRALSALTLTSRAMSARALAPELTRTALAPTVTLASGYEMPVVALGTWKAPAGQTGAAVEAAIKAGYRNIDAANDYNNEPEVGAAIKKCIARASPRDELFVQRFLCSLGYFSSDEGSHYTETWRAMEALVAAGKCRSIGLSNFNKAQLEEVVAMAKVPVSILQNECHPYLQQKDLVDVCRTHGVAFQAFSPLGSGDTNLAVGPSPTGTTPLKDPVVNAIADRGQDAARSSRDRPRHRRRHQVGHEGARRVQLRALRLGPSPEDTKLMDGLGWRHLHWRETSHHPDYPSATSCPSATSSRCPNFAPGQ
ncbi:oxidoreductase [Aureococcus anophagefferens]|nr:oxidoreductase [Aureococcus anophagefferens]